jgi:glycyl-tRNA synthetase
MLLKNQTPMAQTIDEMAAFCKKKGFVYPNSEIYGGMTGFYDFGPYGVEISNSIKREWWRIFVQSRDDIVGIDGCIIAHPKVWKASGHVDSFQDLMLVCGKCKHRERADIFLEEKLKKPMDGVKAAEVNTLVEENGLTCPKCGSVFKPVNDFNLMFKTHVGPVDTDEGLAYLRPETAQLMFVDFRLVADNARMKLPFGIAQVGKAFRNEISPRNFLFRCREFEQMEIEYFIHPEKIMDCPYVGEVIDTPFNVLSAEMQDKGEEEAIPLVARVALDQKIIKTPWHAFWLAKALGFYTDLGAKSDHFRIRQHLAKEKSHYALDTWDLEYKFPFGWKEILGIANRTDYDLMQHIKHSKADLSLFDEDTKTKVVPHVVAEPSFGVGRSFLVFLFDAFDDDKERGNIVLHLHPRIAPIKVGVFPLVNKLHDRAKQVHEALRPHFMTTFDKSGSIGRRYARADELGIPYCLTIDFGTENDGMVTLRDRETTQQKRIRITELRAVLQQLIDGERVFASL